MRRRITFGFFWMMLVSSLFGCTSSDRSNPNRNQPNMNTTGTMNSSINGVNAGGANTMSNAMPNTMSNTMSNANAAASGNDFWTKAAEGGLAEVELGRLASSKAQNPEVKKFAAMMVADHTKNNEELKALAAKKSVTLPTALNPMHQSMRQKLEGLSGAEFDRAYMEGQVADHQATVALMETNANHSDADVKAFAAKTLPVVREHLEMARGIQGRLK